MMGLILSEDPLVSLILRNLLIVKTSKDCFDERFCTIFSPVTGTLLPLSIVGSKIYEFTLGFH